MNLKIVSRTSLFISCTCSFTSKNYFHHHRISSLLNSRDGSHSSPLQKHRYNDVSFEIGKASNSKNRLKMNTSVPDGSNDATLSSASREHSYQSSSLLSSNQSSLSYHTAVSRVSSIAYPLPDSKEDHVVARIVPNQYKDYEVRKPTQFRVDSSLYRSILQNSKVADICKGDSDNDFVIQKLSTIVETDMDSTTPSLSLSVVIDLNVKLTNTDIENNNCLNEENENASNCIKSINLHMNRDGNESAIRTLERLDISTKKKVDKLFKSTKKSKKKNHESKQEESCHQNVSSPSNHSRQDSSNSNKNRNTTLLYRKTNDDGDCNQSMEYIIGNLSTLELIRNLSVSSNNDENKHAKCRISIPSIVTTQHPQGINFICNPPTIVKIETPFENFSHDIYVGIPITIQTTLIHSTKVIVSWFADDQLVKYDSLFFIPTIDHVDKVVTVLLQPINSVQSPIFGEEAYQFDKRVQILPEMPLVSPLRDKFIHARDNSIKERQNTLRVVTYNILADLYVSRDVTTQTDDQKSNNKDNMTTQFPHVPNFSDLRKTRRLSMIISELLTYKADIVCLQEVDGGSIFSSFIEPVFNVMGYDGYYSNKASCQREGCFLGWSRDVFETREVDLQSYSIRDLFETARSAQNDSKNHISWDSIYEINKLLCQHHELRKVIMEKIGSIAQIATLRLKNQHNTSGQAAAKPNMIVVANTHLFYHPLADHIRAMQAYVVCKKVDEIRRQNSIIPSPFILSGDLNSDPLSGAAQLLFTRTLHPEHHDCWKNLYDYKWDCGESDFMVEHGYIGNEVGVTELKYEEEAFDDAQEQQTKESKPLPPMISLPTSFPKLTSGVFPCPSFTNFAVDFIDCLDYVLASEASDSEPFGFKQKRSAPMPAHEDIIEYIAMPNEVMPSDHVSVVCDLQWDNK